MIEQDAHAPAAGAPVTGAWREDDDPGHRRFREVGDLQLESRCVLPDVRLAFETWGRLDEQPSNDVLVLHALTDDSHVCWPAGPGHPTPGQWEQLVGPGSWALVISGSMGGMRALEWAVGRPSSFERLAVIASASIALADQIAWNCVQRTAIRACGGFAGGDYYGAAPGHGLAEGLAMARRIAHTTYRTADELEARFANLPSA